MICDLCVYEMCSGCSSPCPWKWGHPVHQSEDTLSSPQLSATAFTHVQFPLRFPSKTPAFFFLSGCPLNTDWNVIGLLLILSYFFDRWGYQICILQLPWLLEEVEYTHSQSISYHKHTWSLLVWEKTCRIGTGIRISVDAFTSLQCHGSRLMMDAGCQQIMQGMRKAGRIPTFL